MPADYPTLSRTRHDTLPDKQVTREIALPSETMLDILDLCGKSDLAALCRVSFRWLQFASGLLYKDIKVDEDGAVKLFCTRVSATDTVCMMVARTYSSDTHLFVGC